MPLTRLERGRWFRLALAQLSDPDGVALPARGCVGVRRWDNRSVATIRVACPTCGDVEVGIESARLVLGLHPNEPSNVLEFACPTCSRPQQLPVGERATRLLGRAGVTVAASVPSSNRTAGDDANARDAT